MSLGIEMVGENIRDNLISEPLGDIWNQFPPLPQGPLGILPPPS